MSNKILQDLEEYFNNPTTERQLLYEAKECIKDLTKEIAFLKRENSELLSQIDYLKKFEEK